MYLCVRNFVVLLVSFVLFLFIYLFGCARFYLTSCGSDGKAGFYFWQHVGCSSL